MNFVDYRERLGLGFDDMNKYSFFKSFMLNVLVFQENHYPPVYTGNEYFLFCLSVGKQFVENSFEKCYYENVYKLLSTCKSLQEFLSYYIFFVFHFKDINGKEITKKELIEYLETALNASRIPFEVIKTEENFFVFPKGAKELDEGLVTTPLEWLKDFPQAHSVFCRALKQYSDGEYTQDVADNFRKALELFLKEFLNNEKDLENNRNEICKYLKEKGVDKNITNMLEPLLGCYKKNNDDQVKHNNKLEPKLLEFVMYQTGLFIRMIITVGKEDK